MDANPIPISGTLPPGLLAVGASFLIAWFPLVMLAIVVLFLVVFFWLMPKFCGESNDG